MPRTKPQITRAACKLQLAGSIRENAAAAGLEGASGIRLACAHRAGGVPKPELRALYEAAYGIEAADWTTPATPDEIVAALGASEQRRLDMYAARKGRPRPQSPAPQARKRRRRTSDEDAASASNWQITLTPTRSAQGLPAFRVEISAPDHETVTFLAVTDDPTAAEATARRAIPSDGGKKSDWSVGRRKGPSRKPTEL